MAIKKTRASKDSLAEAVSKNDSQEAKRILSSLGKGIAAKELLLFSIEKGNRALLEFLVDNGRALNSDAQEGMSFLYAATEAGNLKIFEYLLNKIPGASSFDQQKNNLLHIAASKGNTEIVDLLINKDADVNSVNDKKQTPLHVVLEGSISVRTRREEIVKILLIKGADVNAIDKNLNSPLHIAMKNQVAIATIKLLLDQEGINANAINEDGNTALHIAMEKNSIKASEVLLEKGIDFNITNQDGDTPLHIAIKAGHAEVASMLMAKGADISVINAARKAALDIADEALLGKMLLVAVTNGDIKSVSILLEKGADVNFLGEKGNTPLHIAVKQKNISIVQLLLNNGASVFVHNDKGQSPISDANGRFFSQIVKARGSHVAEEGINDPIDNANNTELHSAAYSGELLLVKEFILAGGDVNAVNINGETPLHMAAQEGHMEVVNLLLLSGANIDAADKQKNTPLHSALSEGSKGMSQYISKVETAHFLAKKGADIEAENTAGDTPEGIAFSRNFSLGHKLAEGSFPIHYAVVRGSSLEDFESLVSKYGKVNASVFNEAGISAMHIAVQHDRLDFVEVLLNEGVDVNISNKSGVTPLHVAVIAGNVKAVNFLLQNGANINAADEAGNTPLKIAKLRGSEANLEIVNLLEKEDAKRNHDALISYLSKSEQFSIEKNGNDEITIFDVEGNVLDVNSLLHYAAEHNIVDFIEFLISHNYAIDAQDDYGYTPLHIAAYYGNVEAAKSLISNGADIHIVDSIGDTVLYSAYQFGDDLEDENAERKEDVIDLLVYAYLEQDRAEFIDLLLANDEDILSPDEYGNTFLHMAAKAGAVNVINKLIAQGADVNIADGLGNTPLHYAAYYGHKNAVEKLINQKAEIDAVNGLGNTPLHLALFSPLVESEKLYGNEEGIKSSEKTSTANALVKAGASIDAKNHMDRTPREVAASEGMSLGVQEKRQIEGFPLHEAVSAGDLKAIEKVLQSYGNVNFHDIAGNTPLHLAIDAGRQDIVDILIEHEADVTLANEKGVTPIQLAQDLSRVNIAVTLINEGASIFHLGQDFLTKVLYRAIDQNNIKVTKKLISHAQEHGLGLLHYAAKSGNTRLIEFLSEQGYPYDETAGLEEATPLCLAAKYGNVEAVRALLKLGADVNGAVDKNGNTALHFAAVFGHEEVVKILLDAGAEVNIINNGGNTALHYAVINKSRYDEVKSAKEIVKALRKEGADVNITNKKGKIALDFALDTGVMTELTKEYNPDKQETLSIDEREARHQVISTYIERLEKDGREDDPKLKIAKNALAIFRESPQACKEYIRHYQSVLVKDRNPKAVASGLRRAKSSLFEIGVDLSNVDGRALVDAFDLDNKAFKSELYSAITENDIGKIEHLLPRARAEGINALRIAVRLGKADSVSFLLENGYDANSADKNGVTLLHRAAFYGYQDIVEVLVDGGANVNAADKNGDTPLRLAIEKGDIALVEILLEVGADVNLANDKGVTPLHFAVQFNKPDVVRALLLKGSNFHAVDGKGLTPLKFAEKNANTAVSQVFADVREEFDIAVINDNPMDIVGLLDYAEANGIPALHIAAKAGSYNIINFLINKEHDRDAKIGKNEITPLFLAAQFGHIAAVDALLAAGANVNAVANNKDTSLHIALRSLFNAIKNNDTAQIESLRKIIESLVEAGADMTLRDSTDRCPMDLAPDSDMVYVLMKPTLRKGVPEDVDANGEAKQLLDRYVKRLEDADRTSDPKYVIARHAQALYKESPRACKEYLRFYQDMFSEERNSKIATKVGKTLEGFLATNFGTERTVDSKVVLGAFRLGEQPTADEQAKIKSEERQEVGSKITAVGMFSKTTQVDEELCHHHLAQENDQDAEKSADQSPEQDGDDITPRQ